MEHDAGEPGRMSGCRETRRGVEVKALGLPRPRAPPPLTLGLTNTHSCTSGMLRGDWSSASGKTGRLWKSRHLQEGVTGDAWATSE